jgi:SAM-dependent methyltransferase
MKNTGLSCRFCNHEISHIFTDLGSSPLANSYLNREQLSAMEPFYPLCVYVCEKCFLVQLPEHLSGEAIFSNYAYFSSFSESWLRHAREYTRMMIERFQLNSGQLVIEIASNDGYLLKNFIEYKIQVLGVEPATNVAQVANEAGIPTIVKFFGKQTALELVEAGKHADLIIGNNVLAHVPALNDFVKGMKILLKAGGVVTMEFPHLMRLIDENQFDTIYHEHFSYFSLTTVEKVFSSHGLTLFDVDELSTHGGSLRIYARHDGEDSMPISDKIYDLKAREAAAGFNKVEYYFSFLEKVKKTKRHVLNFLIKAKEEKKSIAAYGAPAKGNTLLNYCGVRTDFIDYTVDRSPHKQGKYLPGSRIPIFHPDKVKETRPDYLVIFPWNLKEEIMEQMSHIREWGGRFVVCIPEPKVY